jgi:hypothetical protein
MIYQPQRCLPGRRSLFCGPNNSEIQKLQSEAFVFRFFIS